MRFSAAAFATALILSASAAPAAHRGHDGATDLTGTGGSSSGGRFPWGMFMPGGGGSARPTGSPNRPSRPTGVFPPGGAAPTGSLPGSGGSRPSRPAGGLPGMFPSGGGGGAARPTGGFGGSPARPSMTAVPEVPSDGGEYPGSGGSSSSPSMTAVPNLPGGGGDLESISFALPTPKSAPGSGFGAGN
jgi:hypothetical protein